MYRRVAAALALPLCACELYFSSDQHPQPASDAHAIDAPIDAVDYNALCGAPDGPGVTMEDSQVAGNIAGRWWRCGGADEFYGRPVEFTADLHFYLLSPMNGSFVRNLGPTSSGTYSVVPSTGYSLSFAITQLWGDGTGPAYNLHGFLMEDPRKMSLGGGGYVAIP